MNRRTPAGEALTDLILEVFRVNGDLIAAGDRIASEFGQSSARWQVIGAIEDEAKTVSAIARQIGLTRQAVQRTVDLLAGDQIVEYLDNPAHRRSMLVAMTTRGRRTYDSISAQQAEWVNRLSADMGVRAPELRRTLRIVDRLRLALEKTADH